MASLNQLLGDRLGAFVEETNLEQGEVYTFTASAYTSNQNFCWIAPAAGTAIIEVWGASGSGALQCCCGPNIPGNPGAYAKQTVCMPSGCYICGFTGHSCCNADSNCFRGCSEASCVQIRHGSGDCSCLCAEGGAGGFSMCSTGTAPFCCFVACNFSGTSIGNDDCGMICNDRFSGHGFAYGSDADVLCDSRISCTHFRNCNPCCERRNIHYVATAPGVISTEGSFLMYQPADCSGTGMSQSAPDRVGGLWANLNTGNPNATTAGYRYYCWGSGKACQCYQSWGIVPMLPYGVPGIGGNSCDSSRDHGMRGGMGTVRIRFIRD